MRDDVSGLPVQRLRKPGQVGHIVFGLLSLIRAASIVATRERQGIDEAASGFVTSIGAGASETGSA